jgi:hypothetical protein
MTALMDVEFPEQSAVLPPGLRTLTKEEREKVIQHAKDVLDRDGWTVGMMHRPVTPYSPAKTVQHCMIGAVEQALVEQGFLDKLGNNGSLIGALMGWGPARVRNIMYANDTRGRIEAEREMERDQDLRNVVYSVAVNSNVVWFPTNTIAEGDLMKMSFNYATT